MNTNIPNWKSIPDSTEKREAYYGSLEWAELRVRVTKRSKGVCEQCKAKHAKIVHHVHYRNLYNEPLEDLLHLCLDCNKLAHPKYYPKTEKPKVITVKCLAGDDYYINGFFVFCRVLHERGPLVRSELLKITKSELTKLNFNHNRDGKDKNPLSSMSIAYSLHLIEMSGRGSPLRSNEDRMHKIFTNDPDKDENYTFRLYKAMNTCVFGEVSGDHYQVKKKKPGCENQPITKNRTVAVAYRPYYNPVKNILAERGLELDMPESNSSHFTRDYTTESPTTSVNINFGELIEKVAEEEARRRFDKFQEEVKSRSEYKFMEKVKNFNR